MGDGYSEGERPRITTGFGVEDIGRRSKKKISCRYGGREVVRRRGSREREREKSNGGGRLLTLAQNVDVSFVN